MDAAQVEDRVSQHDEVHGYVEGEEEGEHGLEHGSEGPFHVVQHLMAEETVVVLDEVVEGS